MIKSSAPIGVFDSGVGGLTVVKEIMEQLPGESIICPIDINQKTLENID